MFTYQKNIDQVIKMDDESQKAHLRLISRVSIYTRCEIFEIHKNEFHRLRQLHQKNTPVHVLSYCALIISIEKYAMENNNLNNTNFSGLDLDEIKKLSSKKAKLFLSKQQRIEFKRDKLLGYWSVVKTLREDSGFSFRKIKEYLKSIHRLDVAHSTIFELWRELEEEQTSTKERQHG